MATRSALTCLVMALAGVLITVNVPTLGAAASQTASGIPIPDARQNSARLIVESGAHIYAFARLIRTGAIAYERTGLFRHRVCLVLRRSDSVEWGLTMTHLPEPGIATVGATARIPLRPEISAVVDVSAALTADTAPLASHAGTGWGIGLEWKRVTDPLVLSTRIGYSGHTADDVGELSISGSVSLLVTDLVSLSGSASISGICQGRIISALGASLAYRHASGDTLYARVEASLAPSDSACVVLGISHELE